MTMSATGRQEISDRSAAIRALVNLAAISEAVRFPHLMLDGTRVTSWHDAQAWCAYRMGRSVRTVQRAYTSFKAGGEKALHRGARSDRGISRFFRSQGRAAIFVAYLRLAHAANSLAIYHAIVANHNLLDLSSRGLPSYETVRTWLNSAPRADLIRLALEGQNVYRSGAASYLQRGTTIARKARSRKRDA